MRNMENISLQWVPENPVIAIVISLSLNILVAISGVLPSAAITAGNIIYFGFEVGLIVSIIGEAAGAVVTFMLYRKGLNKIISHKQVKSRLLRRLKSTQRIEALFLVLILRVLPFIPSGAVTLAAAYSQMGLISFSIASTIGKIPSLFLEAYSVDRVLKLTLEWQIAIVIFVIVFIVVYKIWRRK